MPNPLQRPGISMRNCFARRPYLFRRILSQKFENSNSSALSPSIRAKRSWMQIGPSNSFARHRQNLCRTVKGPIVIQNIIQLLWGNRFGEVPIHAYR